MYLDCQDAESQDAESVDDAGNQEMCWSWGFMMLLGVESSGCSTEGLRHVEEVYVMCVSPTLV